MWEGRSRVNDAPIRAPSGNAFLIQAEQDVLTVLDASSLRITTWLACPPLPAGVSKAKPVWEAWSSPGQVVVCWKADGHSPLVAAYNAASGACTSAATLTRARAFEIHQTEPSSSDECADDPMAWEAQCEFTDWMAGDSLPQLDGGHEETPAEVLERLAAESSIRLDVTPADWALERWSLPLLTFEGVSGSVAPDQLSVALAFRQDDRNLSGWLVLFRIEDGLFAMDDTTFIYPGARVRLAWSASSMYLSLQFSTAEINTPVSIMQATASATAAGPTLQHAGRCQSSGLHYLVSDCRCLHLPSIQGGSLLSRMALPFSTKVKRRTTKTPHV